MKIRRHQGNKSYKITWFQRTPNAGGIHPQPSVYTIGQNPTATLNAFLFGRDRTNILADIRQHYPEFCWRGCDTRVKATCVLGIVQPNLPTV